MECFYKQTYFVRYKNISLSIQSIAQQHILTKSTENELDIVESSTPTTRYEQKRTIRPGKPERITAIAIARAAAATTTTT